jgi:serine/threonine-protein kinase HipA
LHIDSDKDSADQKRFTIVDLWGTYILKPPTTHYLHLPEVEDLTMHLAQIAKISAVPHGLIRLKSGTLSYITKRIDRVKKEKRHMEDMCQLTERLSEDKYHGSYEQIAKTIKQYSVNPGLDVINFYEIVLFSFLTGNADMHLKNFSLIHIPGMGAMLAPAYDLVATTLVNPDDKEDMALTLNGRKNKIKRSDFISAFKASNLDEKQQENIFKRMIKAKPLWFEFIDISFLNPAFKKKYKKIIKERFARLEL